MMLLNLCDECNKNFSFKNPLICFDCLERTLNEHDNKGEDAIDSIIYTYVKLYEQQREYAKSMIPVFIALVSFSAFIVYLIHDWLSDLFNQLTCLFY